MINNYLTQYFNSNLLAVNAKTKKQCNEIFYEKNKNLNNNINTKIGETINLPSIDKIKFLGIITDQHVNFYSPLEYLLNKLSSRLFVIRKLFF